MTLGSASSSGRVARVSRSATEGRSDVPRHVAIIMDGNGRWAARRGQARHVGHSEGAKSVERIITACARMNLEQLTLYAFSAENWKRPRAEVAFLMNLLREFLISKREKILRNNIRLTAIGRLDALPAPVRATLDEVRRASARNTGMVLCLALNYGGRQEIVDAASRLVRDAAALRRAPKRLDEKAFRRRLYDGAMSDPDLLIRTGGEKRLSNFLLWQLSYAELWFTRVCWPDFSVRHLRQAFRAYARRERRFGGLSSAQARRPEA